MKQIILPSLLAIALLLPACGGPASPSVPDPELRTEQPDLDRVEPDWPPESNGPDATAPATVPDSEAEFPDQPARPGAGAQYYAYQGLELELPDGWSYLGTLDGIDVIGDNRYMEMYLATEDMEDLKESGQETLQKYYDVYVQSLEEDSIPYGQKRDFFIGQYQAIAYDAAQDRDSTSMITCVAVDMRDCFVVFMAIYFDDDEKGEYEAVFSTIRVGGAEFGQGAPQEAVLI